jgi:CDP-glucose 4,6-dehydratase
MTLAQESTKNVEIAADQKGFWPGKRVLITGHTGFKGAWLMLLLNRLGATVTGIALAPEPGENLYTSAVVKDLGASHFMDIRDTDGLVTVGQAVYPEIVIHLAARSLVSDGYRDPMRSFSTNVMGTVSVLEAARSLAGVRAVVVATSDKVYRDNGWSYPYRETDPLGGQDPYSASKAAAEIVTSSYARSFLAEKGITVCTVRAGNVIGGGDWAGDRLVPDAVRAWIRNENLFVRNPHATRPWQHVLEPLTGYLAVARLGFEGALSDSCLNFGPNTLEEMSVCRFLEAARTAFRTSAGFTIQPRDHWPESKRLALDISRARDAIGFEPRWTTEEAIARTMAWYRRFYDGEPARSLCLEDIDSYAAGES